MVYRSNNNANANGGVSYANSWNDAANANANIGSRLANNEFRKFGVQHGERVPKAVPMGMSHSNSATSGKLEKQV